MDRGTYEEGQRLRSGLMDEFRDKYIDEEIKVLIFSPDNGAWFYGFQSWKRILDFMGINTDLVYSLASLHLSRGHDVYIGATDIAYMDETLSRFSYKVGLVSKQNEFITKDRTCARDDVNIEWMKELKYNHLISSFSQNFLDVSLKKWIEEGFNIETVPFGFNPLIYYPVQSEMLKTLYFFVGTNSVYKRRETSEFLIPIISKYPGTLRGVGWEGTSEELQPEQSKYFYGRARISLNYHMNMQKDFENEVNERTFVIPACGGFQLVDEPKMLRKYYSRMDIAIASDDKDYFEQFEYYLDKPELRNEMSHRAMVRSYKDKYDLFHRIEPIITRYIDHRCTPGSV